VLKKLGSTIEWDTKASEMVVNNSNLKFEKLDREDLGNMKGISLLWGPMLARFGKVKFQELPGGCTLGCRTLGPHYQAFRDLGVTVNDSQSSAEMILNGSSSGNILLREVSPTATENAIMLATGLKGKTKIIGAGAEPQVQDLCNFLVACGAKISGIGSSVIKIEGGHDLIPVAHHIITDDHEVSTFISLVAATGGELTVYNTNPEFFLPIERTFANFGVSIEYDGTTAHICANQKLIVKPQDARGYLIVRGQPWPGLMVDNLPLFIPLAMVARSGQVLFHNWMYDAGLFWTSELQKFGANIIMADPHRVIVTAGRKLTGSQTIEAPYIIRATVALAMAAMVSEGESIIKNADVLYRGHPNFAINLRDLGAKIEEIK